MRNFVYRLLRSSERITKTDMVYLAKGGFWLGLSHVALAASALLLAVVFARVLPKEIYGNYKYILSIGSLVGALTLSGIGTAITRSVARGFEGIVKKGIRMYLVWSIGAVLITLAAALYYFINGNTVLASSLAIVSIGVPLLNAGLLFNPFVTGRKQFRLHAQYSIVSALVPTALLIVVATLYSTNVPLLVLTYFIAHAGTAYVLLRYTIKRLKPNDKVDEADVTYGKHVSVMNILTAVAAHIDKVLLFQLLGAVEVAVYTFATALPAQLRGLFKIVNNLIFPKLSENQRSRSFGNIFYKTILFTIVIGMLVTLYILFAKPIFELLFPAYVESVVYSQVVALALIGAALGVLPLQALHAHRSSKKLYLYHTVASLFEIGLMVILIFIYGIWGAVWARIASRVFNTALLIVLLAKQKTTQAL